MVLGGFCCNLYYCPVKRSTRGNEIAVYMFTVHIFRGARAGKTVVGSPFLFPPLSPLPTPLHQHVPALSLHRVPRLGKLLLNLNFARFRNGGKKRSEEVVRRKVKRCSAGLSASLPVALRPFHISYFPDSGSISSRLPRTA